MSNINLFKKEAKAIRKRNQFAMDQKFFLCHYTGYDEINKRHKKEIQALALKYGVDVKLRKWKLNKQFI